MRGKAAVLWAEDNRHDQLLIEAALDEMSPRPSVRFADDGVLLLDALRSGPAPDLVVLDLKMPRMGGIEALRRIRAEPAWVRLAVAVFSAGNQPDEVAACRQLGARDVVQKPVDFHQFTQAVARVLRAGTARAS